MQRNPHHGILRTKFVAVEKALNGEASVSAARAAAGGAGARFRRGVSRPRAEEEWRFTNVAPIAQAQFAPVLRTMPPGWTRMRSNRHVSRRSARRIVLVFVNGLWSREFSVLGALPPGVTVGSLAAALARRDESLAARLGSLASRGRRRLYRAQYGVPARTARLSRWTTGWPSTARAGPSICRTPGRTPFTSRSPGHLIVGGKGSRLSVVETYAGDRARRLSDERGHRR